MVEVCLCANARAFFVLTGLVTIVRPPARALVFILGTVTVGEKNHDTTYGDGFFKEQGSQQCVSMNSGPGLDVPADPNDPNFAGASLYGGLWSGTCGSSNTVTRGPQSSSRIVGGHETEEHQYPWMVNHIYGPVARASSPRGLHFLWLDALELAIK